MCGTLIHFTTSYLKGREGCYGIVEMSGIKLIGSFESLEYERGHEGENGEVWRYARRYIPTIFLSRSKADINIR